MVCRAGTLDETREEKEKGAEETGTRQVVIELSALAYIYVCYTRYIMQQSSVGHGRRTIFWAAGSVSMIEKKNAAHKNGVEK